MMTGGVNPNLPAETRGKGQSPRSRGIKKGLFIFLLTFLIVPIIAILTVATNAEPYMVVIASILLAVGGLLRMAYAMMFESSAESAGTGSTTASIKQALAERIGGSHSLPPPQTDPIPAYMSPGAGKWQNTNELEPASVTDGTTQLLENQELDQ